MSALKEKQKVVSARIMINLHALLLHGDVLPWYKWNILEGDVNHQRAYQSQQRNSRILCSVIINLGCKTLIKLTCLYQTLKN